MRAVQGALFFWHCITAITIAISFHLLHANNVASYIQVIIMSKLFIGILSY